MIDGLIIKYGISPAQTDNRFYNDAHISSWVLRHLVQSSRVLVNQSINQDVDGC